MDLKSVVLCKQPRRSNRLEMKKMENIVKSKSLGYFDILPLEVKFHVLTHLSIDDLSILTITSKVMRNLIEGFKATRPTGRHLLPNPFYHTPVSHVQKQKYFENFKQLGLLMKRSTCLYATRDRLKFINDFLLKLLSIATPRLSFHDKADTIEKKAPEDRDIMCTNTKTCNNSSNCIALVCFGKFLHTVIAGWDDSECQRAFDSICLHTGAMKNVTTILNTKHGMNSKMEIEVRSFFRQVFLDYCENIPTKSFWLSCIFKSWPMVHQAKLLYLLYGPATETEILWYEMCENTFENCDELLQNLGRMANTIHYLYHFGKKWSDDNTVSVVDELTNFPDQWLSENIADLLILSGNDISSKMLISKAINGRIPELSELMGSFCIVCVKNNFNINYVVSSLWKILEVMNNPADRNMLLNNMMDILKRTIMELHFYYDPEVDSQDDMFYAVSAITELTKNLMHLNFKRLMPEGIA